MKKAKKGLLLSLLTLLMAVAVTATSTYAWFVVNREVTATNMQVTVKSDTTWLVIGANATAPSTVAAIGTDGTQTTAAAASRTAAEVEVLPVRYNESATPASGSTNWETASGTSYTNGAAAANSTHVLTTSEVAGHYVMYTFYVGLTATSSAAQANLKVNSMSVTANASGDAATFLPAVSAMVECTDTNGAKVDYEDISGMNAAAYTAKGALLANVAVNTVYTINVYVYINGDNAVVKSENAAKLGGFTLEIEFGVSQPSA